MQAHDWPWQWHERQPAVKAACRQALRARRGSQWSPYTQMTARCRRIVGIPTPGWRVTPRHQRETHVRASVREAVVTGRPHLLKLTSVSRTELHTSIQCPHSLDSLDNCRVM